MVEVTNDDHGTTWKLLNMLGQRSQLKASISMTEKIVFKQKIKQKEQPNF